VVVQVDRQFQTAWRRLFCQICDIDAHMP
jgi:hypothetical protein